jgi:hypothetical protein
MRRPKFERQASPTRVIKQLPLQAQLSRVKMSETPSQTSRDRNLSEGSVVGPYTIEFPASLTAKDGFQQAPIPSRSAAAFFAAGGDISRCGGMDRGARLAARILEHRPQRCGDARPFAGPPSSWRRNSACGVCAAAVGGGYRVIDLALAERSARLYRRLRGEANRSGSADLEQGARPKSASRLTLTLRSRSSDRSSGELR